MKKVIKIMMVTMLAFTLVACGNNTSAKDSVVKMLEAYKQQNWSEVSSYFEEEDVFDDMTFVDGESEEELKYQKLILDKISDIEYEIIEDKEENNKASVTVKIKSMNVGEKFLEGLVNTYTFAFSDEISNYDSDEINSKLSEIMYSPIEDCTRTVENTLTLPLVKKEDKWVIAIEDTALINALMGGLIDAVEKMQQ